MFLLYFNVGKHSIGGLNMGQDVRKVEHLAFEAAEEVFSDSIIIRIAFTAHALVEADGNKGITETDGRILDTPVGMKYLLRRGPLTPYSHFKSLQDQLPESLQVS